ncbi:MAG: hypothetical protein OXC08_20850 [Thiotrichales bacterium]|nr:hypothetical protein [Thiotrichales bacterium]
MTPEKQAAEIARLKMDMNAVPLLRDLRQRAESACDHCRIRFDLAAAVDTYLQWLPRFATHGLSQEEGYALRRERMHLVADIVQDIFEKHEPKYLEP